MRKFNIKVNGISYQVEVEESFSAASAQAASAPAVVQPKAQAIAAPAAPVVAAVPAPTPVPEGGIKLKAPMPGNILKLKAKNGADVKKGEVLLVLEAMKMENDIVSPADGKVSFSVSEGATVATDDLLAVIA